MRLHRVAGVMLAVGVLAAMFAVSAAVAGGGNSANAKLCQKNGWKALYRSDGTTFASETACTSYGAKGGTIRTAVADVSLKVGTGFGGGVVGVVFCAFNAGPSAATITVHGEALIPFEGVDYTGSATQTLTLLPGQSTRLNSDFHFIGVELGVKAYAQVASTSAYDPDSTPNNYAGGLNGPAVEDDAAFVHVVDTTRITDCD